MYNLYTYIYAERACVRARVRVCVKEQIYMLIMHQIDIKFGMAFPDCSFKMCN